MANFLAKAFGFDAAKHNVRTEIVAGITTFLTMAYILAVNPGIFSNLEGILGPGKGMPGGAVFTATALAAIVGTLVMAVYAKKPFGLAPGMGLNAFFVFTVCVTMGYTWQFALTAVLIEGIIFIILSATRVRTWILESIPVSLKHAIGAGIGLFIAFIGFQNAGIIVNNDATLVGLGKLTEGKALLGVIGLVISGTLVMLHIRGGILVGILITAVIGLFIKDPATGAAITQFNGVVSMPDSIRPIFCQFEWGQVFTTDMLVVVLTFLFIDMFDTMGTVVGVSQKAGFVDEKGNIDGADKVFMADAIGTVAGACFGTSTTTTYVESAAGVGAGGRTGLCGPGRPYGSYRLYRCGVLRPGAVLLAGLPRHSRCRYGPGPHHRGYDDDEPGPAHRLAELPREHPRLPDGYPDAAVLFDFRRYPDRRHLLRGALRLRR